MKKNPNFIKMERVESVIAALRTILECYPIYIKFRMPLKNVIRFEYDGLLIDIKVELRNKSTEMWAVVDVTNDVTVLDANRVHTLIDNINQEYSMVTFGYSTVIYTTAQQRLDQCGVDNGVIVRLITNLLNWAIMPWYKVDDPLLKARK